MVTDRANLILEHDEFTQWMAPHLVAMVGTYQKLSRQGEKFSQVGAMISITFVQISKLAALPSGVDAPPGNWFIGKVDTPFSIAGMSGAPVFGFRRNSQGQWEYRPVAIQSRWYEKHQIIFATPISPVMRAFEESLQTYASEANSRQTKADPAE